MFRYRDENFYVIETLSLQNKSWHYKFKACTTSLWLNIQRGIEQVARGTNSFERKIREMVGSQTNFLQPDPRD